MGLLDRFLASFLARLVMWLDRSKRAIGWLRDGMDWLYWWVDAAIDWVWDWGIDVTMRQEARRGR